MLKYYFWAVGEKALSYVPFSPHLYYGLGYLVTRKSQRRLQGCANSYRLARKAKELTPPGGTIMDFGTAWHHHDAFLLYLIGDYKVYLFDVEDKAKFMYIKTYIEYLLENLESVCSELSIDQDVARGKLNELLPLKSRRDIYRACNFELIITKTTDKPFLPEGSIDFIVSNCVLPHIPPHIMEPELGALRSMLKKDGYMYMMTGHDDHWAFHDASVNQFNYYKYSDEYYKALFDTKFEYQNRFVKGEYLPIFDRARLEIVDYYGYVTEESRANIRALPHLDERFAKYPVDELATIYSYFLLRRAPDVQQTSAGSSRAWPREQSRA
ncbi:MAG: class I SAM-dependent methyltransferase [Pseudomonadota bacterium]|nr:class I SAM-dependent methyltransferase [Pseudomonadota bacterium]